MNLDIKANAPNSGVKNICFVQLTRMGDLIQTYRVVLSYKKYNPDAKLYLVARKKFASPLKFLLNQCFDEMFLLDVDEMVENVESRDDLIKNISKLLENVNLCEFDELFNLSWSGSSEYLCSLIKADNKKGMVRNHENKIVVDDQWSRFVYSIVMKDSYCPYNIVDIYNSIANIRSTPFTYPISKITACKRIVVHPFASNDKKYWKHTKWTEVIYKLLKSNSDREILIVGAESDGEMVERILKSPILDKFKERVLVKTNDGEVDELLNILACSELFVGHDSFVSHLAALTDIPIITLALGTVRVCETAPYGTNSYIISPKTSCYPCFVEKKCDFYKCHADIPYQVVAGLVDMVLNGECIDASSLDKKMTTFLMSSVDIFKTSFKESGFLCLHRVTDSDILLKDIFMIFYRVAYLCFFDVPEEKVEIPKLNRKTMNELRDAMEGLEYVYNLYQFGKTYTKSIVEEIKVDTPCMVKIKSNSSNIDEIERLQNLLGNRYPVLKPMIDFFTVERRNVKGSNIVEISEESFYSYHASSVFTSMMYELCEKTIGKYEGYTLEKSESL